MQQQQLRHRLRLQFCAANCCDAAVGVLVAVGLLVAVVFANAAGLPEGRPSGSAGSPAAASAGSVAVNAAAAAFGPAGPGANAVSTVATAAAATDASAAAGTAASAAAAAAADNDVSNAPRGDFAAMAPGDADAAPPAEETLGAQPPYVIPSLALGEGTAVFTYLGAFLSYITPHDLPVLNCVLELLRAAFHARLSLTQLIMEALKIESGFICLIALFALVALVPLAVLTVWGCTMSVATSVTTGSDSGSRAGLESNPVPPVDSLLTLEESLGKRVHCRRRALQFSLQVVTGLLVLTVTAMIVTNEQMATAINRAPDVIRASLKDAEVYLKEAQRQIGYNVKDAADTAVERVAEDLDAADKLLGEPIQKEIKVLTGIDVAFESVGAICAINSDISHRITLMHDSIAKAILICQEASTRIDEIQSQLVALKRQCIGRDRPLCETLRLKGFGDNEFVNTLQKLQHDPAIYKMLTLGEQDLNGITRNLTTELSSARDHFAQLADHIQRNTSAHRSAIRAQLQPFTGAMQHSNEALASTVAALIERLDRTWTVATPWLDGLEQMGATVWSLALAIAICILLITVLLVVSLGYGCARAENRASAPFVVAAASMGCASLALALFTVFGLLLGGHGEVFVCRALYDEPDFLVLGRLFDRPGLIAANGSDSGVIGELVRSGGRGTGRINASLPRALLRCERGDPAYEVFQLEGLMNVSANADYSRYTALVAAIEALNVSATQLCSVTDPLQSIFEDMYVIDIDLSAYRTEINQPALERDMITFIDQLQHVSMQVQDVGSTSRMATLGNRARRLQTMVLQPLEQVRSDIVYHLTALELQREPWTNQVNQSLLQLKTTQFFLNRDAGNVFAGKVKEFRNRLRSHLTASREHLMWLLKEHLASCKPLYRIFEANRLLFCRHTMDPLNGLWFCGLVCIVLWVVATPLALGLASIYRRMTSVKGMRHTNSHQAPTDALIISEQSNWASTSAQRIHANIDRSNW